MTADLKTKFDKVTLQLERLGLLLLSDYSLPSVSSLVADQRISGSWWAHKAAHTIFAVNQRLEDHPDVMIMKLVSGKVTFVHRELWPHVYSIGVAREDWQVRKLPREAKLLLKALDEEGSLRTNTLGKKFGPKPGDVARELELRLLLHADQIHTESGAHAKLLETWDAWAERVGFRAIAASPSAARLFLEERLKQINNDYNADGRLPWQQNRAR